MATRRRVQRSIVGGLLVACAFGVLAVISWWATLPVHQFGPDTGTVCGSTLEGDVKDGSVRRTATVVRPDLVDVCLIDYPRAVLPDTRFRFEVELTNLDDAALDVGLAGAGLDRRGAVITVEPATTVSLRARVIVPGARERSFVETIEITSGDDVLYRAELRGGIPSRSGADWILVPRVGAVVGMIALGVWVLIGILGEPRSGRRGPQEPVAPVEEAETIRGRA